MISSGDFLALMHEQTKTNTDHRPTCRLGTVDPAFNGTVGVTGAKITFSGESTLSGRGYLPLSSYTPVAGHRVLMLRVGNTWVMLGKIGV